MERSPDRRFRSVLQRANQRLRSCLRNAPAGSGETPYLDALLLLAHATRRTTEQVLAGFDENVPVDVLARYEELIDRRCAGEPVSYLRGFKEFYGRDFLVGFGVLVPRPDTELLVESALNVLDESPEVEHVHDCCTGSGCVAVTIASERTVRVTASDISADSLSYARENLSRHGVRVDLFEGDLLDPLRERLESGDLAKPGIITANPPYVADNEVDRMLERGWPEPAGALAGGPDGLDTLRRLVAEAGACLSDGGWLMVEFGFDQGMAVQAIFRRAGFVETSLLTDLAGRDRVCKGKWLRA